MSRLLIVGAPRSGTTWIGQTLGRTNRAVYVHEPDGDEEPFAFRSRFARGFPAVLSAGDADRNYERLFAGAFAGGRWTATLRDKAARSISRRISTKTRWQALLGGSVSPLLRLMSVLAVPQSSNPDALNVIVKSVRCIFMLDWLVENFHPSVIVVERNPFNVMASWIELNFVANLDEAAALARKAQKRWNVAPLDAHEPQLAHQTFAYGVLACTMREAAARHDDWTIVSHEQLCSDPPNQFHALAAKLGLPWGDRATKFLAESNRDGTGFKTNRRAKVQSERWRERLNEEQIGIIRATLGRFPSSLIGAGCFVTMIGMAF